MAGLRHGRARARDRRADVRVGARRRSASLDRSREPLMDIVDLAVTETYTLPRVVLRDDDPNRSVMFPEDDDPKAFHLGVRDDSGTIVAISSWIPRPCPVLDVEPSIQLRGMATASDRQGSGLGGALIEAGAARSAAAGYALLWARARDTALAFYERHGCRVIGEVFTDPTTALAHHIVVRELPPTN